MRVLHVTSSIDARHGGPSAALIGLASAQAANGANVGVVSTYGDELPAEQAERLADAGCEIDLVPSRRFRFADQRDVRHVLRTKCRAADIIHIHGLWEPVQWLAAVTAREAGRPYIFRPCGMLDPWSLAQRWFIKRTYLAFKLRRLLQNAVALHYTTAAERDHASLLRLRPSPIVEPNGVDLREYADLPPRGTFRSQLPDHFRSSVLITFMGRVHAGKGLEHLLEAMPLLPPQACIVAIGPETDDFGQQIRTRASELGVSTRLHFTGMLNGSRKIAALADSDLFALPSDHENFGIAIIEALAASTPVVISDQVGIHADVSTAGVGAVTPLHIPTLARTLSEWVIDSERRDAASALARPFALRKYDWRRIAESWMEHYERFAPRHHSQ